MSATDPVRDALERTREAVLSGGTPALPPREVVSRSWERSLAAHVDPEHDTPPYEHEPAELERIRRSHPLAPVLPLLRQTLVEIADQAKHMMIVTDERGLIMWREGDRDVLRRAEPVGLVEGTRWSEDAIGTNAMGTALAADEPVTIHSAEHLVRTYHSWTCAAAPIHDPDTGELIGAVDVTGAARTFHPTTLALVVAAAKLAESHLAAQIAVRDERLLAKGLPHLTALRGGPGALLAPSGRVLAAQPAGWLPARVHLPHSGDRVRFEGGEAVLEPLAEGWLARPVDRGARTLPVLTVSFLGAHRPVVHVDGRPVQLSRRHAELLALLVLHPEGLTADALATMLHGDHGKTVTIRAEVHRLRGVLGPAILRTQPYRLTARVDADFREVREALMSGRVRDAALAYRGPLLPCSDAPAIREERELLTGAVRAAVLRSGDVDAMWALLRAGGDTDPELLHRLRARLPDPDPRRAILAARPADDG
ncbi:GAF domain-containing protein [Pseudonocardia thermophila]|uniref:GAF domain-containing protein n=1 Tax=Pseudonocardia thermophila TaxID=1848 RepID=A0A1M6UMB2_PSETH|nr:GAF domain-containing protein [Pseudonocardia thermophila]SHK70337.1 GAF domain-containing protein [Pseudonocardia thermophila]